MKRFMFILVVLFLSCQVMAQEIRQELGVDPRVDYKTLTQFGPWDDRNYQVTQEDLALLSNNEHELFDLIPAFFRVELRREFPYYLKAGPAQYPRAARQLFEIRYGGLMLDGVIQHERPEPARVPVPVNGEIQLNQVLGANESTVEINPVFPDRVIGGSNNNGGQEMYYSADGGLTWNISGTLPNTCCDPTVGWSSDGTIAYAAALSGSIGVSFYRSIDFGQTWGPALVITPSGSDKEWLHADISSSSPYIDNVYLTYHNGNTMQFARSTDMGVSFETPVAFGSAPSGIGSDITTDSAGNIYYFYGAFGPQQIIMLKSSDGGDNFDPPVVVASTNGSFDWPIPAMESRRAWIYVATDADRSGGPFDGSIYASWTDTVDPETGTASLNHTQIHVYYSRDGGATWNSSIPHPTIDSDTVDRFNQWMTVDTNGVVHVVFYDTRHSVNRTGVDLYYTFSQDGAVTWNELTRVSSQTSANLTDGQEWGDYNGISVIQEKIIPTWTDNRDGPPNAKDVYAGDLFNVTAEPTFLLGGNNLNQTICAPDSLTDVTVDVSQVQDFMNDVTFSFDTLPAGFTGGFSQNPVTPPGQTIVSLSVDGTVTGGNYEVVINASAMDTSDKQISVNVVVQTGPFAGPTLVSPADGDPNGGIGTVQLGWDPVDGAVNYHVQLSDDPGFGTTVFDTNTPDTSFIATGLIEGTVYYWRVATINACSEGAFSAAFSFTADAELILLVDQDDGSPDVRSFFEDTLNALAVSYKVYDTTVEGSLPTNADMAGHPIVVWFSGDRFAGPTVAGSVDIATYLDGGGTLFLSSQDYLYPDRPNVPVFGQNYLAIQSFGTDDGDYTSVSPAAGGIFDGLGTITLNYPHTDYSDNIVAAPAGSLDLVGNNTNGAAIVTANTVFFSFPFTAIANNGTEATSVDAQAVMSAIIEHFVGDGSCAGSGLSVDAGADATDCPDAELSAVVSGGAGPYTYDWQPAAAISSGQGTATPRIDISGPTTFTVTVTDGNDCPTSDTITITPFPVYDTDFAQFWLSTSGYPVGVDADGNGTIDMRDYPVHVNYKNTCPE